jgi:hypothetical protein
MFTWKIHWFLCSSRSHDDNPITIILIVTKFQDLEPRRRSLQTAAAACRLDPLPLVLVLFRGLEELGHGLFSTFLNCF